MRPSLAAAIRGRVRAALSAVAIGVGLAALLLGPSVGCGAGITPRPVVRQTFSDAKITTNVKTFLLNDPQVGGLAIDVQVRHGVVTLSGIVPTTEDAARAEDLARHVAGVKDVRSLVRVQP